MRTGIIAEGKSDSAVITNILKGKLGINRSDISYLVPELEYDETDLARMREEQFSNWTIVKKHCVEGNVIRQFLSAIDDQRFLVIHLDTAERLETNFGVLEPIKENVSGYSIAVCEAVLQKIKEWLGENLTEKIVYAIAVEEIEAWVIPIFELNATETEFYPNPKERLYRAINRPNLFNNRDRKILFQSNEFDKYLELSKPFRKQRDLTIFCNKNSSLMRFCVQLEKFAM